jgi:hypothetical protein
VFSARGLICECVNGARELTPQAGARFLERKRVKIHVTLVWINTARCKKAGAISFGEGRGPTWPFGTHHVKGGVWSAWVCACANHIRPTHSTRRELGLQFSRNEELIKMIYRQAPHKSPHEVSRIRRVLLGDAARLCHNIVETIIIPRQFVCECLKPRVGALDASY